MTMTVRRAQIAGTEISQDIWNQLTEAQQQAKKLRQRDSRKGWTKHLNRGLRPLLEHNHKEVWKWIRSMTTKQQCALPIIPPTRDADGNMLSDVASIMEATTEHYSTFATDQDPRPIDWWETRCPMEDTETIEELNEEIRWSELNSTLHQLKLGKCPGMDHIPNEFLRLARTSHDILEPDRAIGTALLRACNAIFAGHFSDAMNTSLIISLPKPGKDFTFLDNRRGISLISCLMKLVTKIIANRIQDLVVNSASGLRKEQAGFRRLEECNAQVATLREIAARREQAGKPTYVAFMDLQKAFDMIPHNGMLHALRSRGISEKCYYFIKRLYDHGLFRVLLGPNLSQEMPLQRGVRQGDSLSPILFNLVMDSCLNDIDGVHVPGVDERIPGLLLADDAAIFAETYAQMMSNLRKFGEWASAWKMKIGHSKCGLMVLHDPLAHETARNREWITQGHPIPVVDSYKYLGLTIDTTVSTDAMAEARADVGRRTLGALGPFLANKSIHLQLKKLVIKTILIPKICYGAEVWAHNLVQIKWGQTVLDNAIRLCLIGNSTSKSSVSVKCALQELDIPNISAVARARMARAWIKWRQLHTWIADLIEQKSTGRRTWTQQTNRVFNKTLRDTGIHADLEDDTVDAKAIARLIQTCLSAEYRAQVPTRTAGEYHEFNMRYTSSYIPKSIKQQTTLPLRRLARTRLNAWPGLLYRMSKWKDICQREDFEQICASCQQPDRDTLFHIHMECPAFQTQREQLLGPVLEDTKAFCRDNNVPALEPEELWQACLGGLRSHDTRLLRQFATFWLNRKRPQRTDSPRPEVPLPREDHSNSTTPPQREENRYVVTNQNNINHNSSSMQNQDARRQNEDSRNTSAGSGLIIREAQLSSETTGHDTADHEDAHQPDADYDPRTDPLFAETDSSTSASMGGDMSQEDSALTSLGDQDDGDDSSSVDPSTPLWQRVAQFVEKVLTQHFSNIQQYLRRFGEQPGRPRANAPFSVRQHFGTGPETRLSVVRQHILRAVDHIQSTAGLAASGSGTRAHSSRQGVG